LHAGNELKKVPMLIAGTHRTALRPGKPLRAISGKTYKENPNMKKLSHLTILLAASAS
jgi:hypothetical protein